MIKQNDKPTTLAGPLLVRPTKDRFDRSVYRGSGVLPLPGSSSARLPDGATHTVAVLVLFPGLPAAACAGPGQSAAATGAASQSMDGAMRNSIVGFSAPAARHAYDALFGECCASRNRRFQCGISRQTTRGAAPAAQRPPLGK